MTEQTAQNMKMIKAKKYGLQRIEQERHFI
ncbi:hypothetical protein MY9_1923 [Bacillus sp. JS]|nr:hypothetical protein MY9_1923 [Bacillus sp. JS]